MKLNQVPGIFEKLLELTLEFLSGSGWVSESSMPNFGQHTKHSKNLALKLSRCQIPQYFGATFECRAFSIENSVHHQTLVPKFPGVFTQEPLTKLGYQSSVGIPQGEPFLFSFSACGLGWQKRLVSGYIGGENRSLMTKKKSGYSHCIQICP
jgi:hypothetical protein